MVATPRINDSTVKVTTACCGRIMQVPLTLKQEIRWRNGELIQKVAPDLMFKEEV